jgi:[ribosomal protein S5]-alanine N-acetyltransferase
MLETSRLLIKPLTCDELKKYVNSEKDFANEYGYKPSASGVDEATKEAIKNDLLPCLENLNEDFEFSTMWILIEKKTQTILGGFCFHGLPDSRGEVEIGYGTDSTCRNKGYMTEVIKKIVEWATGTEKVKAIKAETENENISSYRVLEKNGFILCKRNKTSSIWKLEIFDY